MPPQKEYQATLVRLLSYLDNVEYPNNQTFSQQRLSEITPTDIVHWMNVKCFGVAAPNGDANPVHCQSTSLASWKKALSHFMPNCLMAWNEISNVGNPTRSALVNDLIKRVKKKEVRRLGVQSKARRSLTDPEFHHVIDIVQAQGAQGNNRLIKQYGIPALMTLLFSMIACIDDGLQFKMQHFKGHNMFPNQALQVKLNWSKNVNEELDAPWQSLLGAMNPAYCVFCNLALWLEVNLMSTPGANNSPYVFAFSGDIEIPSGGNKSKNLVQLIMQRIFSTDPAFVGNSEGPLGSHSIREYASSFVRQGGTLKDDWDLRAWWRKQRCVADVYDDVEMPFVDLKVCAVLCVGGPVVYMQKPDCVTNEFILQQVVPNLYTCCGQTVGLMLGRALLWLIYSDQSRLVPAEICMRVKDAYNTLPNRLPDGENPIEKKIVVVTGDHNNAQITEIDSDAVAANVNNQNAVNNNHDVVVNTAGGSTRDLLFALISQVSALQQSVAEQSLEREQDQAWMQQHYRILTSNIRRIGQQPHCMLANHAANQARNQNHGADQNMVPDNPGNVAEAGANAIPADPEIHAAQGVGLDPNATLSPTPQSLYDLWHEWTTGIGGRKPARLFTAQERGWQKHKFSRCKIVWQLVSALVQSGLTSDVAIDRIYNVYGQGQPVTRIIHRLKEDIWQNCLHQDLSV
ncbi:hypothetical protein ACA910_021220 [Epithemia clementina (nom. ined.)]